MNVNLMLLRAPCPGPGRRHPGHRARRRHRLSRAGAVRGEHRRPRPARTSGPDDLQPPAAACSQLSGSICVCGHSPKCRHDHKLKQHPAGKSTSYPTEQSGGPLPRAGATPLNPPATRSEPVASVAWQSPGGLPHRGQPQERSATGGCVACKDDGELEPS